MSKCAVIMGRFQPITIAHYNIIKDTIEEYKETFVVIINSKSSIIANTRRRLRVAGSELPKDQDKDYWKKMKDLGKLSKSSTPAKLDSEIEKNPFSGALRAKLVFNAFNSKLHQSHIIQSPTANIEQIINKIYQQTNNKDYVIFCGSDRESTYKTQIQSAKDKGYFPDDVNVEIKITERNMDDADNVSATKVRQAIKSGDKEEFKNLVPSGIHDDFDRMRKFLMTETQRSFFRKMLLEMIHIEDLKVDDFIDFVKNIYETEASVKLDGNVNILAGFDSNNKFYTGLGRDFRDVAENKRKYSPEDWLATEHLKVNGPASAHKALETKLSIIRKHISANESFSNEILFGDKPNCIKYDFDGVNHLVVLNNDKLAKDLKGKVNITIDNYVIETDDLEKMAVSQTWEFGDIEKVDAKKYDININNELKELEDFLNDETSGSRNLDILGMKAMGKNASMVKEVREKAAKLKLNIKEKLLQQFVRQVKGGQYPVSHGYSHEGIVLKKGDKLTKIIDKEVFTNIHKKDWEPVNAASKIVKQSSKEEAIKSINDMIKNFDSLYPDIKDDTKRRMINNLKMTKLELNSET